MSNFIQYHIQFKSQVNEEDRVKTSVGSDSLARQEKAASDIKTKPLSETEYTRRMNMNRNVRGLMIEQSKVKQPSDYMDCRSEREGIHNISSRGLMFIETQLEINERTSFGSMLHEQKHMYGRTQV